MIQSRIASLVASFSVLVPNSTARTSAPSRCIRSTFGRLPAHVLGAHVDDAVEAEARADRGGRDAVLAGAGLGDDALLAEPLREHGLAERVVELVRARVEQVLALEVDAPVGVEARGAGERRRPAGVGRAAARAARARTTSSSRAAAQPAVSSSSAGISVSGT